MTDRVLVIEDSATERALIADRLEQSGYLVSTASTGDEGVRRLYDLQPDIILLDVVMPGLDGWSTLALVRQITNVPVIMLTGLNSEIQRVRGLRGGADDYIGKPYGAPELVARIQAVLRRTTPVPAIREIWDDGTVRINYAAAEVTVRGQAIKLTPLEFRLLAALTEHAGQVLSPGQLLGLVWGDSSARSADQVKLYVGYLRRKIERDTGAPELIDTVRGFGYRYRKQDAAPQG